MPEPPVKIEWLPAAVVALLCSLVGMLWWTLDQREQANLRGKIRADAEFLASHVDADLRNRIPTLLRMTRRWEMRGGTPREEFINDARTYLQDVPGFQALGWVDKSLVVRWIVPKEGNERAQDLNLAFEEKRRGALEKARTTKSPTATAPVDLVQGGTGFQVYCPIQVRGEFDGFILAIFRIQEWLDYVFNTKDHRAPNDVRISARFDEIPVFKEAGWDELGVFGMEAVARTEVLDHELAIHVRPMEAFIKNNRTLLPKLVAGLGILLSLLAAFIVYLLQKTAVAAWRVKAAKAAQELEMRERKETEEIVKKSEAQVRLLLNSTAEAIYGIDLQGDCTFANPACLRLLGYADHEQLLGRNMHILIHHSYTDGRPMRVEDCRIYQAFREGKRVHVDDEVLWKADGASFPAEYWSYPEMEHGRVVGAVVAFIDISERKQAQEALVTERQRLSSIIEGTNVGTWEWNVLTGATVFNERWAAIVGYSLAELQPVSIDTWTHFAHPDDLRINNEQLAKHFDGTLDRYEVECRMRHKDGHWVWVLDRGKVATWTADGKPLMMFGTHQDITVRKQSEAEREKTIQELQKALTEIKTLRGIVPICASCKKIRNDKGYWEQVEKYVTKHTDAQFSHGICPDCAMKLYPDYFSEHQPDVSP